MDLLVVTVLAGIVAKGLGAIAVIFLVGVVVGVMATVLIATRVRSFRKR